MLFDLHHSVWQELRDNDLCVIITRVNFSLKNFKQMIFFRDILICETT